MVDRVLFRGGNTGNLRAEVEEREKYRTLVDFEGMIDTLYHDFSYGFLNEQYEPVYTVDDPAVFANFPEIASDVRCLGFVANAFAAFRDDYIFRVNNTNRNYPRYLEGVIPALGYESFEESFSNYTTYVSVKYSSLLVGNLTINDFSCYLDALKELMIEQIQSFPITRSGFTLSKFNNVRSSGLVVELAKLDYNSDLEKGEILQSKDFTCFLDYATTHGFFVDKYAPWRLYANLKHPTIKAFLRRGSENNEDINLTDRQVQGIMNSIYRIRAHKDDLYDLQDFVIKIYNDIKNQLEHYTRRVYNPSTSELSLESVFREEVEFLTTEQWLDMLLFVRMLEVGVYSRKEHSKKLREVLEYYKIYGVNQAIEKVGNIMSYYIREIHEANRENNTNT